MNFDIDSRKLEEEGIMKISFEGTPEAVRAEAAEFFGLAIPEQGEAPTLITNGAPKPRGRPAKAPVDTTAAAGAPPPAAPSPAQPAGTMMPMCKKHAADVPAGVKPIPAEESACVPCTNDRTIAQVQKTAGKAMTLDEVKAVANELGESRADGWDTCFRILNSLGADSLTGAEDTKALDPSRYEEFAKQFVAAMGPPPAAPAKRKSL